MRSHLAFRVFLLEDFGVSGASYVTARGRPMSVRLPLAGAFAWLYFGVATVLTLCEFVCYECNMPPADEPKTEGGSIVPL